MPTLKETLKHKMNLATDVIDHIGTTEHKRTLAHGQAMAYQDALFLIADLEATYHKAPE